MDRSSEADQSREGLLRSKRRSEDDGYQSSSDEEDLNAMDYLDVEPSIHKDQSQSEAKAHSYAPSIRNIRRTCARRAKCLLVFFSVIIVLWIIIGGGGLWVYKKAPANGQSPPWYPTPAGGTVRQWSESYKKAAKLVKQMSLVEKVNITTGTGWQMGLAVGQTHPALHVGFPALAFQDGPLGLRFADNATAFPAGITVGATWNKGLMYKRGKAHGNEARLKGINVLLGPCVGPLGRMPAGGRNWEVSSKFPYQIGH
jgi:beta-glucosidase